jgi:glutathione gamma-glutamylcysteinyltransferase
MICPTKVPLTTEPLGGMYQRPLPASQIPFSSVAGRLVFQEALLAGSMHSFFPLIEQFLTQAEPSYCGISSLVMVLNALHVDPKRLWKGSWRWFSEDIADCCEFLEGAGNDGITLNGLTTLARCNGLNASVLYADAKPESLAVFRREVLRVSTGETIGTTTGPTTGPTTGSSGDGRLNEALVVSYSRASLGQTGDGHFSPIGGYHAAQDLVLLLDVARFKYPPHWVALPLLWQAMQALDTYTGLPRGYIHLKVMPFDQPCGFTGQT